MDFLSTKNALLFLIIIAIISLYVSYKKTNLCLINNFTKTIYKWKENPLVINNEIHIHYENDHIELNHIPQSEHGGVRLVPLLDDAANRLLMNLQETTGEGGSVNSNNAFWANASPKYKFFKEQGLQPVKRLPSALIVGVKKGGTRALLEFIRVHPDVRAAGSEIHFFDKQYVRGFEWYREQMPSTLEGQITIEKTPSYFITKEAPHRVHLMNPSTKLLLVVRDPVTRAISDYTQARTKKPEMKRFETMTFVNNSRAGTNNRTNFTPSRIDISWGPIKLGIYARYLIRWLKYFPLSQFLFVSGERLVLDPALEMRRVQEFLGLKCVVNERHFYFNSTKGFPCLYKSEGHEGPKCLGKTKGRNHPIIDPIVLNRLKEFYKMHNQRFYQMTGIHFGWS